MVPNASVTDTDLTWLFWTKRCERIAWKGAGHAEEQVQRTASFHTARKRPGVTRLGHARLHPLALLLSGDPAGVASRTLHRVAADEKLAIVRICDVDARLDQTVAQRMHGLIVEPRRRPPHRAAVEAVQPALILPQRTLRPIGDRAATQRLSPPNTESGQYKLLQLQKWLTRTA